MCLLFLAIPVCVAALVAVLVLNGDHRG
jgi:hypothetical protein